MKDYLNPIALIIAAFIIVFGLGAGGGAAQLAGDTNFDSVDVSDGYKVDATSVIDGSGNWTGAINVTANSATLATTTVEVFTQGGEVFASSTTNTSETFVAEDLSSHSVLELTPNTGNTTYTLMASSSWTGILANPGDIRTWKIENATTSTAITATIAAGTGIELLEPDGQNVVITGQNYAELECWKRSDTDIACVVDEYIDAD